MRTHFLPFAAAMACCSGVYSAHAHTTEQSFGQLAAEGRIVVELYNPGRHMGESLLLTVRNTGTDALSFSIPAGWIFESVDAGTQSLLLVHEVGIDLEGGATATAGLQTYCVEADKNGPKAGAPYGIGHMGGERTTAIARFIDMHRFRDQAAMLMAIWATCGDRPVSDIRSDVAGETEALRARVRELLAPPEPAPMASLPGEPAVAQLLAGSTR